MNTKSRARAPKDPARRRFTKAVATALAAAPLICLPSDAHAQTPPATKEPAAPPNPQPTPTPQPPSPVAEAYGEVARVRFGDRLTADELARVKRSVAGKIGRGNALRDVKLQNGDEPDFIFNA